jgi:hypothetical protein
MTDLDLTTWANTTAGFLTGELPLQSLNSAVELAFAYISDVGGWVPDDPSDPNGPGEPANHATPQTAATAITAQQVDTVYDIAYHVVITTVMRFSSQLGAGLSLDEAAAAMATDVGNFVSGTINNSPIPIRASTTIVSQTPISDTALLGGSTTEAIRQKIQEIIQEGGKLIDYKQNALVYARATNGLDDTWNVSFVYTQSENPIVVTVVKYTDTTYASLDSGSTAFYVYSMSPTTYQVVSGVTIST